MYCSSFCLLFFAFSTFLLIYTSSSAVDEISEILNNCKDEICGDRVSRCIRHCNCSITSEDLKVHNCTCCKDCFQCLGDLFPECCSCVGLCRPTTSSSTKDMSRRSSVAILAPMEDQISLFELVTAPPLSSDSKWTVKTYPAIDSHFFDEFNITSKMGEARSPPTSNFNCTVAFMKECLSLDKCDKICTNMGASSYRWFHTGCCECVGHTCINFGWLEGLCQECPGVNPDLDTNTIDGSRLNGEL